MYCRSCGYPIRFIRMRSGRNMPCDDEELLFVRDPDGDRTFVTDEGDAVKGMSAYGLGREDAERGFTPHWASCPAADDWRRKKR